MDEPEDIVRARALIERGKVVVEDQIQRIDRLRAIGASTADAEKKLMQFNATMSALETYLSAVQGEARRRHWP